ncbi:MAG: hypothetical protein JNK14_14630 [Chitinophagaceae bacterium]|nr:hypothetical protein [Chitinophagaceae bacterium]
MKNFLDEFIDFITGGFFNYLGAAARILFTKEKFSVLVKEKQSNHTGMLVMSSILFGLFLWIKLSVQTRSFA